MPGLNSNEPQWPQFPLGNHEALVLFCSFFIHSASQAVSHRLAYHLAANDTDWLGRGGGCLKKKKSAVLIGCMLHQVFSKSTKVSSSRREDGWRLPKRQRSKSPRGGVMRWGDSAAMASSCGHAWFLERAYHPRIRTEALGPPWGHSDCLFMHWPPYNISHYAQFILSLICTLPLSMSSLSFLLLSLFLYPTICVCSILSFIASLISPSLHHLVFISASFPCSCPPFSSVYLSPQSMSVCSILFSAIIYSFSLFQRSNIFLFLNKLNSLSLHSCDKGL